MHLNPPRPLIDRFMDKVKFTSSCWLWTGATYPYGYGCIAVGQRKIEGAHRVAYVLFVGPIPIGLCVLHRCDRPLCVNPRHLFLGTKDDNLRDMISKKRHAHGMKHGDAHFTDQQIFEIRDEYQKAGQSMRIKNAKGQFEKSIITKLAERYGVNYYSIRNIVRGETWKHLLCHS